LIWNTWADDEAWRRAKLFWLWGGSADALPLVSRALRYGLPILAPRATGGLTLSAAAHHYDSLLDALGWLAALQDDPLPTNTQAERAKARLLTMISPPKSFGLMAPIPQ